MERHGPSDPAGGAVPSAHLRGCFALSGAAAAAVPVSWANRSSVSELPSIERVYATSARFELSSVTDWKSRSSRSPLHPVPSVQIGPLLTGVGSTVCGAENVAPPSVLSRYASDHCALSGTVSEVPLAFVWYSETATCDPDAATHGYTDAPPLTSVRGADHEVPQFVLSEYRIRLELPTFSAHTAARWPPPPFATTGNACVVSASLAGETVLWLNVSAPLVDRAKLTPPVEVA